MQQLPRCAGTLPINLIDDPVKITGRNDGAFWFQSAVTISAIRDGTSSTAAFSERCLGNSIQPDPLGDVYEISPTLASCARPARPQRLAMHIPWNGRVSGGLMAMRSTRVITIS